MQPERKQYNPKIIKLGLYLGYGDAGKARLDRIRQFAASKSKSITALVLEALKAHFPDIGL